MPDLLNFATVQKRSDIKNLKNQLASIIMVMLLLWLTVSVPYIYADQTKKYVEQKSDLADSEDSTSLPNTTEEKAESGVTTVSEYLHELHVMQHHFVTITSFYKCHPSDLYFAFHPELVSPPPEA